MSREYGRTVVSCLLGLHVGVTLFLLGRFGILLGVLLLVCSVPWIVSLKRGSVDFFEPIHFASIFMFVTAYSLFYRLYLDERTLDYRDQISIPFEQGMTVVIGLYILLYTSILVGYYLSPDWYRNAVPTFPREEERERTILKYSAYLYMIVGLVFYWALVQSALDGNLLHLFVTSEPRSVVFEGAYHIKLGAQLIHVGYFLWIVHTLTSGSSPKLVQLLVFVPVFWLFLLLGGRGAALNLVVVLLILLYYVWVKEFVEVKRNHGRLRADPIHDKIKTLSIPVTGVVLLVSAAYLRYVRIGWSLSRAHSEVDIARSLAIRDGEFDRLLLLLEHSPREIGYYYGAYYARPILNFIPRALWEGKPPLTIGAELRETVFPHASGGLPPGVVGEFFVNFSYPGVLLGGVLSGIVLRMLYETLSENDGSVVCLYIYAFVVVNIATGPGLANNNLFTIFSTVILLGPVLFLLHR